MKKSKLVFIAGLGTLFESFDFYLFSLFAVALNYSFFGSVNKHSVLWIFLIFAVGYLARIVGALVFGYWGDKLGRLYSFKKTVVIMAISSIVIGFLPTYESIGILAVVFLIILRFIQGISYGGEKSGATIVIMENYKNHQPLLILCISIMTLSGVFLAKFTYFVLGYFLDHQTMINYGWRIAYIFGGIMIFHSYFARKDIAESEEFKLCKKQGKYKNTIHEMFLKHNKLLLISILCIPAAEMFWGVILVYLPNLMELKYNSPELVSNIYYISIFGMLAGCFLGAIFADIINIRVVYSTGTILVLLLVFPFYFSTSYLTLGSVVVFYILLFLLTVTTGIPAVLSLLMLSRRLPVKYRYTLVSTAYAFSAFFFIGLPPFLFSYFTREANMFYPMLVFGIGCIVQLIAVQLFYKKTEQFVS
jgi:MFS family permease